MKILQWAKNQIGNMLTLDFCCQPVRSCLVFFGQGLSAAQLVLLFWYSSCLVIIWHWCQVLLWCLSGTPLVLFVWYCLLLSSCRIILWTVVSVTSLSLHRTWPRFYHDRVRKYWQIMSENIDRSCQKTFTENVWENICPPNPAVRSVVAVCWNDHSQIAF